MTVSGVNNSDIINSAPTTKPSVGSQSELKISFPKADGNVRRETDVRTAIANIAKKYNIDPKTAESIVKSICNKKGELLTLDEAKYQETLTKIDNAFSMCSVRDNKTKKFSKKNAEKTLEWYCNDTQESNGFLKLLKSSGCVASNKKTLSDVSDAELKTAMTKFIKNPDTEKEFSNFKKLSPQQKKESIDKQLKYLDKLLVNVKDSDKERVYKIFAEITKDSGAVVEGFRAVKASFKTPEGLKNFINKFTPNELAFIGVSEEDISLVTHLQASEFDNTEDAHALFLRMKDVAENFRKEHSETFASIENKKRAEKNGETVEYTQEELTILEILKKVQVAPNAGYITGIHNSKINKEGKTLLTKEALNYAEENGFKEDVLTSVNNLVSQMEKEHPEYLSKDFNLEQFTEQMNDLTGGEYSQIVEKANSQVVSSEPVTEEPSNPNGYGFVQRLREAEYEVAESALQTLQKQFEEKKPGKPYVVKNGETPKCPNIEEAVQNGAGYEKLKIYGLMSVAKVFGKLPPFVQKMFAKDVRRDNDKTDLVNTGGNSLAMIVHNFTTEELQKLIYISNIVKGCLTINKDNNEQSQKPIS